MKIKISEFVTEFQNKGIKNTQMRPNAIAEYVAQTLEIKEYLPFNTKKQIIEIIMEQCIDIEEGIVKVNSIAQYLSFITAMLATHTNLEFSDVPANDYDVLSQNGLLEPIIMMFQKDYSECEALLKMAVADALQDNNIGVIVSKFLNGILGKLDGFVGMAKGLDLQKFLGVNMNEEEKAKILGFVDKFIK